MSLRLDWATHEAAKYSVEHWHYSKCMPVGKLIKIGVWENEKFIGVVLYGLGANTNLGSPYGLKKTQCCELVRVAFKDHKSPISRIISIALKFVKTKCPGLRLIVSFADTTQQHLGIIYQASNWIYTGFAETPGGYSYLVGGKWIHTRSLGAKHGSRATSFLDKIYPNAKKRTQPKKFRYLMPLDKEMRKQIEPLRQPYPKRMPLEDCQRPVDNGGAIPTHTLQDFNGKKAELSRLPLEMGV